MQIYGDEYLKLIDQILEKELKKANLLLIKNKSALMKGMDRWILISNNKLRQEHHTKREK